MQQPIAPPYSSFLKQKFYVHGLEQVDVGQAITDSIAAKIENVDAATSTGASEQSNADSDQVDLDEIVEKLKTLGDIPDVPKDYKLPQCSSFCVSSADFFQDYAKKVAEERAKHSEEKFRPCVLLGGVKSTGASTGDAEAEQEDYSCYVQMLLHQENDAGTEGSEEAGSQDNEPEFMQVIKEALISDNPIDKGTFLTELDEAVKRDNRREFFFQCTCDEDSDVE